AGGEEPDERAGGGQAGMAELPSIRVRGGELANAQAGRDQLVITGGRRRALLAQAPDDAEGEQQVQQADGADQDHRDGQYGHGSSFRCQGNSSTTSSKRTMSEARTAAANPAAAAPAHRMPAGGAADRP